MRIALSYIRSAPDGGIEKFLATCASRLASRGHDVTLLCREQVGALPQNVRMHKLSSFRLGSAAKVRAFSQAVERHLEREHYDVVLGLGKTWTQDVLRLGGGLHRVFMEQTANAAGSSRALDRASLEIEAQAFSRPDLLRVIANSEMVRREVLRHFPEAHDRVAVIYNGVDCDRYERQTYATAAAVLRHRLGFSEHETAFLFLGNGFHRKGLSQVLDAFAGVVARCVNTRLMIVGDDVEMARYREQARRLNVESRVVFLGARNDVPVCYAAADVFVLPSRYDPFANATLEALATGLPVITSDRNGGSEVLTEGVNGAVVPLQSGVEGLAEAMQAWSDPERVKASRRAARAAALRHPLESKLDAVEALLKSVHAQKAHA